MINEVLIRATVARIEADQQFWDQNGWACLYQRTADGLKLPEHDDHDERSLPEQLGMVKVDMSGQEWFALEPEQNICGTSFCFAGHAVRAAGKRILFDGLNDDAFYVLSEHGERRTIEHYAAELLGLDVDQADALFSPDAGDNEWDNYKAFVSLVTGVMFE